MNTLLSNINSLLELKNIVKSKDTKYLVHNVIDNNTITNDCISIVMTSHNRSKQVYYTLKTIQNSIYKNVQIILVDDSDTDKVSIEKLKEYKLYIDLIEINRNNKCWHNPCINYNIGFEYIKGSKIIIQNSEVCHVGDVLLHVNNNTYDNIYNVYDVITTQSYESNENIYKLTDLNIGFIYIPAIYNNIFNTSYYKWYQHHTYCNRGFHFLVSLTKKTFDKIGGFSYDYSFGTCYDDDDLLLKIKTNKIKINNIRSEEAHVVGIHLFHGIAMQTWDNKELNNELFEKKKKYSTLHNKYYEISDGNNNDDIIKRYNIIKNIRV
jgi:glycosyltransferase involved in cell wall biosynthesis